MAISFEALKRRLGGTAKRAATPPVFSILGAVVGAVAGTLLLRRVRPLLPQVLQAGKAQLFPRSAAEPLPPLVAMPVGDTTPPHGDALLGAVAVKPRKKRTGTSGKRARKAAAPLSNAGDPALELEASVASVSERSEIATPPRKGSKRIPSTQAHRRSRAPASKSK